MSQEESLVVDHMRSGDRRGQATPTTEALAAAGAGASAHERPSRHVLPPPVWAQSPQRDGLDTLLIGSAANCVAVVGSTAFANNAEFRPIGFVDVDAPPAPGALGHIADLHLLLGASGTDKVVVCGDISNVEFQSVVEAAVATGCQVLWVSGSVTAAGAPPGALWRRHQPRLRLVEQAEAALRIEVYADGADLKEMLQAYRAGVVRGFTTNPTLMRKAGVTDYMAFAQSVLAEIRDLPISFEVFADDFREMARQAFVISSWGENVFVKIPITTTKGDSSIPLVRSLVAAGVKVNVTALMTEQQVAAITEVLSPSVPAIVSVFAGRIADTGRDPMPIMRRSARIVSRNANARLLWASPREVLNIYQAEASGCHIVTATKALLDKLPMRGMDLVELSRQTVQMFYTDAQAAEYAIT